MLGRYLSVIKRNFCKIPTTARARWSRSKRGRRCGWSACCWPWGPWDRENDQFLCCSRFIAYYFIYPSSISHKYHILNLIMVIIIVQHDTDDSADPILTMTTVRESQLSAGFAGKGQNHGALSADQLRMELSIFARQFLKSSHKHWILLA